MSGSETSEVQELQDKDVIIDRVRKLFGDDVAQKFQGKLKLIKKLPESLTSLSGPVQKKLKDFKSVLDTRIPLCLLLPRTFVLRFIT